MFTPFLTTGIGSLPHKDSGEACRLVLESFDIPFWPQLPQLSFHEFMIPQYAEGIPSLRIDEQKEKIWIAKDDPAALTKFYESYAEDLAIPITENFAMGLSAFLKKIQGKHFRFLKGHVTGPLTFTLGLKDNGGRLVFFDEEFREISLLVLKAKIKWQIELLKPFSENIIVFIDEPVLSTLGTSSYLGVDSGEALRLLRETSDAIKNAGGIPGIHCCSKADWPLVINSDVRIISFDAYDYIESISLYPAEFTAFLKRGGYLAWGIVPTTDAIREETSISVKKHFDKGMELLSKSVPPTLLLSQILLTPSCGTGSRNIEETEKVFQVLGELKKILKSAYA
jgi:hypothetical protein